jgi:Protein of unknown function (DUF2849)
MTSPLDQKIRIAGPVVVTANHVADGAVIYIGENGGWTRSLGAAAVASSAELAQALLAAARADEIAAVGAYVAPVKLAADGRILPGNLRERIRAGGPTVAAPAAF